MMDDNSESNSKTSKTRTMEISLDREILKRKSGLLFGSEEKLSSEEYEYEEEILVADRILEQLSIKNVTKPKAVTISLSLLFIKNLRKYTLICLLVIFAILAALLEIYSFLFLEYWTHAQSLHLYLREYILIFTTIALSVLILNSIEMTLSSYFSLRTYGRTMFSLIHASLNKFFKKVSISSLGNRISRNLEQIDNKTVIYFSFFLNKTICSFVYCLALGYSLGYELLPFAFVCILLNFSLQKKYSVAKREYQRIERKTLEPIVNAFDDILNGLPYIRTMKMKEFFLEKIKIQIELRMKNLLTVVVFDSWFSMRSRLLQLVLIYIPAFIGMAYYFRLEPARSGLFFICILQLSDLMEVVFSSRQEYHNSLVSFEDCEMIGDIEADRDYTNVQLERKRFSKASLRQMRSLLKYEKRRFGDLQRALRNQESEDSTIEAVVTDGKITYENVTIRSVLTNFNMVVEAGEKIGIVGKLGASKTTLLKLMYKLASPSLGVVRIDGRDISEVEIKSLRSQVSVVSHDAPLFNGTIRYNLDPSEFKYTDERLEEVLERVDFDSISYRKHGLDMIIDPNFTSNKDRQKIGLARVMICPNKIVLVNEIPKHLDLGFEDVTREVMKNELRRSTVLIVARKVETLMECDKILVIQKGETVEFDTPAMLSLNKGGYFRRILDTSRKISAKRGTRKV